MFRPFIIFIFLFPVFLFAGTGKERELKLNVEGAKWDTLKYQKFRTVLIIGIFEQHRSFTNEFTEQTIVNPSGKVISHHTYKAEANLTGGIVINYDKFQIAFATRNEPEKNSAGKGYTKTFSLGLNVGDTRWISENYFRRYKGFYDNSTPSFDTAFKHTGQYKLMPNLVNSLFMSRFMYFKNHKRYSCRSGYGCNYRQLRSSKSLVYGASFSVYNLQNDSSLIPMQLRNSNADLSEIRGFKSINLNVNIGLAATLVLFKALFIQGYYAIGPEQQWHDYDVTTYHRNLSYVSWSGTGRASMGLNMKRFYFLYSFTNDYNIFNGLKIMSFKSSVTTNNVTLGWRFHYDTPKFYQKFMKTKFYSYL